MVKPISVGRGSIVLLVFACALSALMLALAASAPVVVSESFTSVGSTSVDLHAELNPEGLASSYVFEYGTSDEPYEAATATAAFGTGGTPVGVTAQVENLRPETVYHFRVVATNQEGSTPGEDQVLTTFPLSLGLPDERGYEMVTPAEGAEMEVYVSAGDQPEGEEAIVTPRPMVAAADGEAVAYVGSPTSGGNGSQGNDQGNQYLATRDAGGTWTQHAVQPNGYGSPVFVSFSADLTMSVLVSEEALAPGAISEYHVLYAHNDSDGSNLAFFTTKPPDREPNEFGAAARGGYSRELGEFYAGASADFKHQYFEANDALVSPAVDGGSEENNLYESFEGQLRVVNVLPNGTSEPNASFGEPPIGAYEPGGFSHAISASGARVFWTDDNTGALYVRENAATTSLIAEHATFLTAAADGSNVLYAKGGDIYDEDLETRLTSDLTPGAQLQGLLGASENLGYIYFVADAELAGGATAGKPNVYLLHAGTVTFIATVGGAESYGNSGREYGLWEPDIGFRTSEVTPSGLGLVFGTGASLTGYDNRNEVNGSAVEEVYVYDAADGRLACASCDPSGERPSVAAPGGFIPVSEAATYQPRVISEDGGELFFGSPDPLVPQATDGRENIYEWERDGNGTCTRPAGCISLLSGGTSTNASYLIGTSTTGDDVFMATRAQLSEQDQNELYDLYDARVGVKAPTAESKCTGTGCQGAPLAPPVFATPASETFSGIGNFAPAPAPVAKPKQQHKAKTKHKANAKHKTKRRRRRGLGSHGGKVKSTRGGVRRARVQGGERGRGR